MASPDHRGPQAAWVILLWGGMHGELFQGSNTPRPSIYDWCFTVYLDLKLSSERQDTLVPRLDVANQSCAEQTPPIVTPTPTDMPETDQTVQSTGLTSVVTEAPVVTPDAPPVVDPGLFNPWPNTEAEKLVEREYRVATLTWTDANPADTQLAEIRFPEALFGLPVLKNRLQYFKYYRTGVKVRVQVISPPTQAGAISIAPYPFYYSYWGRRHNSPGQRAQVAGYGLVSAAGGGVYEFILPWKAPQPFAHMAYCGADPSVGLGERGMTGTVFIHVFAPLEMPGAAVTPVTINVFAQLVDLTLAGMSPITTLPVPAQEYGYANDNVLAHKMPLIKGSKAFISDYPQSKKPTQTKEAKERSEKGTISSIAETASRVAGTLALVPGLEPLGVAAGALKMGGQLAESLGLDQPLSLESNQPTRKQGLVPYTHGLSPSVQLTETPGAVAGSLSSVMTQDEVNPSFLEIAKRPGLMLRFSFDTTSTKDSLIAGWGVHPMVFPTYSGATVTYADVTPLAAVSAGFSRWRGTLKYQLRCFAPSMTTYGVRIVYLPDSSAPPSTIETYAGDIVSEVRECRGDTVIEFSIPFLFERLWSKTRPTASRTGGTVMCGNGQPSADQITGYVVIYLITPVSSYDAAATFVSASVWIAAGDDYQLLDYVGSYGPVYASSLPEPSPIEDKLKKVRSSSGQPGGIDTPQGLDHSFAPLSAWYFRSKGLSLLTGSQRGMGSAIMDFPQAGLAVASVRDSFSKPFPSFLPARIFQDVKISLIDPPTSPHVLARRFVPLYSSNGSNIGVLTALQIPIVPSATPAEASSPWQVLNESHQWIHWIIAAFRGFRGGRRFAFDWRGTTTANPQTPQPIHAFSVNRFGDGMSSSVSVHDKFPEAMVEAPWLETNFYQQFHKCNLVVGGDDLPAESMYQFTITATSAYSAVSLEIYGAFADDCQLIDWMPPPLTKAS